MGWLQENGVVLGTFATTAVMVVGLWWRVLRTVQTDIGKVGAAVQEVRMETEKLRMETERLGVETEKVRMEGRKAHASIGAKIIEVREGLSAEIAGVREGLGEIRGELKGVTRSIDTLREDFRAHVFGSGG